MKPYIAFALFCIMPCSAKDDLQPPRETTANLSLTGHIKKTLISDSQIAVLFTGTLVYTLNNYTEDRQTLRIKLKDTPVSALLWDDDGLETPYSSSFKNAIENATARTDDQQSVSIEVFSPIISFGSNGKIMAISGTRLGFFPALIKKEPAEQGAAANP